MRLMRNMMGMFVSAASCERLPMMLLEGGGSIVHPIQPWFKMFHFTSVQLGQMMFLPVNAKNDRDVCQHSQL